MRRRISLYIDGCKADLQDDALVLFNYTAADMANPTAVVNSYSQQVTLPGTPANNRIFGHAFRTDRTTAFQGGSSGPDFNPMRKTPFTIYDELGEILEEGYVKLNEVDRSGAEPSYKVSLFGGLGSFIYALSYDAEGNKRTLADLDYLGTADTASELDFLINATNVKAAWDALPTAAQGDVDSIWKIINFAPALNGIPEKDFDAGKMIANVVNAGLPASVTQDGVTYSTPSGNLALFNLANKVDEWAVKDLRSYLQRPVLSVRAFLEAITNPDYNGGYEVDKSSLDDPSFDAYRNTWLTLPLLPALWNNRKQDGGVTLSLASEWTRYVKVGDYSLSSVLPAGTSSTASVHLRLRLQSSATEDFLYAGASGLSSSVFFIQVVGLDSGGTAMAGSDVWVIGRTNEMPSGSRLAEAAGYVPVGSPSFMTIMRPRFDKLEDGVFEYDFDFPFTVTGMNVARYEVRLNGYRYADRTFTPAYLPPLYTFSTHEERAVTGAMVVSGSTADSFTYSAPSVPRSNAKITKAVLLSTSATPAEYLISFCKVFGLSFIYDRGLRKVTIVRRNDFYTGEVSDLTGRVDLSKGVGVVPLVASSRWYRFSLPGVGGSFAKEYEALYGIPYGAQRVNTGYDFDAGTVELLEGTVLKSAPTILNRSKYLNRIKAGERPSVFIDNGNTYTLQADTGKTIDVPVSVPELSLPVSYYNTDFPGCDQKGAGRPEFRDEAGKPLDGSNVLLFYDFTLKYNNFRVTDDRSEMDTLNGGTPCWWHAISSAGQNVPVFSSYKYNSSRDKVTESLDLGAPLSLDFPGMAYDETRTVYRRQWRAWLSDRFSQDTKVMTCRVDFSGMQVGPELLRRFWWWRGSLWVLNKIKNYSLTTWDPVDCEFIQVQDIDNYTNGQY